MQFFIFCYQPGGVKSAKNAKWFVPENFVLFWNFKLAMKIACALQIEEKKGENLPVPSQMGWKRCRSSLKSKMLVKQTNTLRYVPSTSYLGQEQYFREKLFLFLLWINFPFVYTQAQWQYLLISITFKSGNTGGKGYLLIYQSFFPFVFSKFAIRKYAWYGT